METSVRSIDWQHTYELWPTFLGSEISPMDIWHTFCRSATKFVSVRGLANRNVFSEFREIWPGVPVISCGDMHLSFAGTLVKWCFDNFPVSR